MSSKTLNAVFTAGLILLVAGCQALPPKAQAYWQRVDDDSALWMTGPKAQQSLEQNIASCVREVDEMVELDALRETTPPDTHSEYHRALKASGDLDFYDTPTRLGEHMVSHSDFHDFDSCMRSKGWERVSYVRYQTAQQSKSNYADTQSIRKWGLPAKAAEKKRALAADQTNSSYQNLNQ